MEPELPGTFLIENQENQSKTMALPEPKKKERKILVKFPLNLIDWIQRPLNLKVTIWDITFMLFVCRTVNLK